jgi:hypothetical protein
LHALKCSPGNAFFQRLEVNNNVRVFRHALDMIRRGFPLCFLGALCVFVVNLLANIKSGCLVRSVPPRGSGWLNYLRSIRIPPGD